MGSKYLGAWLAPLAQGLYYSQGHTKVANLGQSPLKLALVLLVFTFARILSQRDDLVSSRRGWSSTKCRHWFGHEGVALLMGVWKLLVAHVD